MANTHLLKKICFFGALLTLASLAFYLSYSQYFSNEVNDTKVALKEVPLDESVELRREFMSSLRAIDDEDAYFNDELQNLFKEYNEKIGFNGIAYALEDEMVACHKISHKLGMFVLDSTDSIGDALHACGMTCTSGCMHGAVEKALSVEDGKHLALKDVQKQIPDFCYSETFDGNHTSSDCAHAVGHALAEVTNDNVGLAIENCGAFEDRRLGYYCGGGVYMNYFFNYDIGPGLYPCDSYKYSSGCFFYLSYTWLKLLEKEGEGFVEMKEACSRLEGHTKLGCYYGLGAATLLSDHGYSLPYACESLDDSDSRQMCVEGYMRYAGTYLEQDAIEERCSQLKDNDLSQICLHSAKQALYGLDRDWSLYYEE